MAAPESAQAYEARLVAYLSANGGPQHFSSIAHACGWVAAAGVPGAYGRFVRARLHLFELVELNYVQLRAAAAPAAAAGAANPAGAASAGASQALLAYQRRIVAFLLTQPGRRATLVAVGQYTQRPAEVGSLKRFLLRWPALFRLEQSAVHADDWHVTLIEHSTPGASAPQGAAPAGHRGRETPATALALQQAVLAFLARQPGRSASLGVLGSAIARPPDVPSLKSFLTERAHLFRVVLNVTQWHVHLVAAASGAAPPGAPPPPPGAEPGCAVCGVSSFSSAQKRLNHLAGRPHLLKTASLLLLPKLGVSLSGSAELLSAPRATVTAPLVLRNEGAIACQVLRTRLLRPLREVKVQCAGAALLPGSSLAVSLRQKPRWAGSTRVMAICLVRFANGVEATVGHEMWLRCADAAAAEDIARLQPTSEYRRPRRPPPPTATADTYTAAVFRAGTFDDAPYAAATMHGNVARLLDAVAGGVLSPMIAAWLPPGKLPEPDSAARSVTATVVMDGVPAADQFGQAQRDELARALRSVLQCATVVIVDVRAERASIIPGVPLGARSQGILLQNVQTPAALRRALSAPTDSPQRAELMARLAEPLSAVNHAGRFQELLLCEEIQQEQDIRLYDIERAQMRSMNAFTLLLDVPGLAEARPSVLRGDKVVARAADGGAQSRSFEGVVHAVEMETLQLRFHMSFHHAFVNGMRHHVRFTLRRTPMLLMHAAIRAEEQRGDEEERARTVAREAERASMLFPQPPPDEAAEAAAAEAAPLNAGLYNRDLNARQQQAVRAALCRGADPQRPLTAPYIIFGPPGTGKTSTVAEYVMQVLARPIIQAPAASQSAVGSLIAGLSNLNIFGKLPPPPEVLVLVAAPSNSAADTVALRLLRYGLPPSQLLRVNAFQRPRATVPVLLMPCSRWSDEESAFTLPASRDALRGIRVVAATCSTAQKLAHSKGGSFVRIFSHVVVDEAGQATEPECLCVVTSLLRPVADGGSRLVLAGDPKQLGPVLRSPAALEGGLGLSFLERLTDDLPGGPHRLRSEADSGGAYPNGFHPAYVTLLTDNYRSHAALLAVPNALFYQGALVARADPVRANAFCSWGGLAPGALARPGGFPLLFHGVQGEDMREGSSPSWYNPQEAVAVLQHVRAVLAHPGSGARAADIGVVTPYHKQKLKLQQLLRSHQLADVEVGSVENFQGAERAVIILSAVRSTQEHVAFDARHALGFLSNPKRFNVAVTRARALLIVVGNPAVLARDECWAALLRHAVRNGAYQGCALPPGFDDEHGGDDAGSDSDDSGGGGGGGDDSDSDGGSDEGGDGPTRLLQRVAAQEAAIAEAEAEAAAGRFRAEELPAFNNDA